EMATPAVLPDILIRFQKFKKVTAHSYAPMMSAYTEIVFVVVKTKSPRPRIQASWVKEKVMTSMSVDDDDRSSSEDEFAQSGVVRRSHKATMAARCEENLARFALHATHISDSGEYSSLTLAQNFMKLLEGRRRGSPDSRASTRSTLPRRSLATPSSYDSTHNQTAPPTHHDDARSIDSGGNRNQFLLLQTQGTQSPTASFMSSPDDDTKSRTRRRAIITRFNSQPKPPLSSRAATPATTEESLAGSSTPPATTARNSPEDSFAQLLLSQSFEYSHFYAAFMRQPYELCSGTLESIQFTVLYNQEEKKLTVHLIGAKIQQPRQETDVMRGKILVALQYNIQQGSLFVTIKRCVELIGMDSTGFSDPYCKV
ncbi:hypothetical protein GCK32_012877, partial [Trichostrongylus colubriformis]